MSVKNLLATKRAKAGLVVTSMVAASPSFAETTQEAITAAVAAGQSSVSLTVAGVIGLAALGFGVGMIVSFLRR